LEGKFKGEAWGVDPPPNLTRLPVFLLRDILLLISFSLDHVCERVVVGSPLLHGFLSRAVYF